MNRPPDDVGQIDWLRRGLRGWDRPWVLATALALALGLAYLIGSPPAADLAAATYRSDLFSRVGFALWDNGWYGGHVLPAYSLLAAPLGAWLGVKVLLALCGVAAAGLFGAVAGRAFGPRAGAVAAVWFALGVGVGLLSGRVPYGLGLAIGLGSLLALQRGSIPLALALAAICGLASALAGAFVALVGVALALSAAAPGGGGGPPGALQRGGLRYGLALAAAALVPAAAVALVFREGGWEPFAAGAFWPELVGVVALGLAVPHRWRTLRLGIALYALTLIGAYLLHTPVGSNATRLGDELAGPLAAGALWERRRLLLALAAPLLLYWQLVTPVSDFAAVAGDPGVAASYYAPLVGELRALRRGAPTRLEVPLTGSHWEAAWLPGRDGLVLARGWERQLDTRYASLFYRSNLTAAAFRAWLYGNAVSYVALPVALRLDYPSHPEAELIERGLPFLSEVWRSPHWRLYAVLGAVPLASAPARLSALGADSFTLLAPRPGSYVVRVHFSPYWAVTKGRGCVRSAPGGWTAVQSPVAGRVAVTMAFSLERIFNHGPRCRGAST